MAPQSSDVTRLLTEAARADTLAEQQRLVAEADQTRYDIAATARAGSEVDLARAVVEDRLTPTPVHELHTTATDWLGSVDTSMDPKTAEREMIAEASVWFSQKPDAVKAYRDEFAQQTFGQARKLAGKYGRHADAAEQAFVDQVGTLHARAVANGQIQLVAFNNGESVADTWHQPGESTQNGLPGERTTSERAPAMQDAMNNGAGGSVSDHGWPDPLQLPQADVDAANGDTGQRKADTQHYQASLRDAGAHDVDPSNPYQRPMGFDNRGQYTIGEPNEPNAPNALNGPFPDSDRGGPFTYTVNTYHVDGAGRGRHNPTDHRYFDHNPENHSVHERAAIDEHAQTHGVHPDSVVTRVNRTGDEPRNQIGGVDRHNPLTGSRKGSSMPQYTAACPECSGCPTCGGARSGHRVAVRTTGVSGLDQIDQTVDPHDNGPAPTQYPTDVAFPWEMPGDSSQAIQETEQQLKQREQLKGASRNPRHQRAVATARVAAERAYLRAMGGQDDSGWLGDMGAGGVRPGMQDGGNQGPSYPGNLNEPDDVYGTGGDNPNQPNLPYGHDEANDVTNNPGMGWQPGQPAQYDMAGRGNQVGQPTASLRLDDPEVAKAFRYAQQRSALING